MGRGTGCMVRYAIRLQGTTPPRARLFGDMQTTKADMQYVLALTVRFRSFLQRVLAVRFFTHQFLSSPLPTPLWNWVLYERFQCSSSWWGALLDKVSVPKVPRTP